MNELEKFNYTQDEEIDFFELIDILVKRKLFIVVSFVLFAIIGLGGALYYKSIKPFILAKQFSINYSAIEKDYFFNKTKIILNQINPDNILLTEKHINKFFNIKELEKLYNESSPVDEYSKVKFLQKIIKLNYNDKLKNYTLEVKMKKNKTLQIEIINTYISILKNEIKNDISENIEKKYSIIEVESEKAKNELNKIEKQIIDILATHSNMISEKTNIEEFITIFNPSLIIEKNKITDIYNTTSDLLIGFNALKKQNNLNSLLDNAIKDNSSIYAIDSESKAKFILLACSILGILFGTMGAFVLEFIENYRKSRN